MSVSDWRMLHAADRGAGEGNGAEAPRDVSVRHLRVSAASAAGRRLELEEAGREAAVVAEMTGETKEVVEVVEVDSAMMVAAPEEPF